LRKEQEEQEIAKKFSLLMAQFFLKIHGFARQSTQLGTRTHISLNITSMH
jgi:hypothetical protein